MNISHPASNPSSLCPTSSNVKQKVIFDHAQVKSAKGLHNQLYAWSRQHNIVFVESLLVDGLSIGFGRPLELTTFLLTWDERIAKPRVL